MNLQAYVDWALDWIEKNEVLISVLSASSLFVFIGTLVFIPWLVLQLPVDYFSNPDSDRFNPLGDHPVTVAIVDFIRNIFGLILVTVGIILLVLPGQGLLTIILGIVVGRFPGKRRFIYWLVEKKQIHKSINWIREKGGKPGIELRQSNDD